jgi:hypothetical protein
VLLTERTSQVDDFAARLNGLVKHIVVLKGVWKRNNVPRWPNNCQPFRITKSKFSWRQGATSAKALTMPDWTRFFSHANFLAWNFATICVGRLHRLHNGKVEVIVYDYVDGCVPVFSAMNSKRVCGYEAVGYLIQDD